MSDTHRTPDPAQPEEARTPQGEASPPPAEAKEKKPGAFGADVYTWLQALVVALTVLLLFFTFFGRVIGVDGHSMDPTLNNGDLLFLQCVGYEPQQGGRGGPAQGLWGHHHPHRQAGHRRGRTDGGD